MFKFFKPLFPVSFIPATAEWGSGATRSKSKSKEIKVKGDVPKVKATEESPVQTDWKNQV
jgi:hypothetical protein